MIIRKAIFTDCLEIAIVQVSSNRTTYAGIMPEAYLSGLSYEKKSTMWEQRLFKPDTTQFAFVAVVDNKVVGFICANRNQIGTEYEREIHALYILKKHQKKGIGKCLMKSVIDQYLEAGANSLILWTLYLNPNKIFYERLGGQKTKEKSITRGGRQLTSIAYIWDDLRSLFASSEPGT